MQNLPTNGAVARAMRGHHWTDQEQLLANVIDAVQAGTYSTVGVLGGKPKKPQPQERPGDRDKRRTGNTEGYSTEDVVTYLDSLRPEKAG